MCVAVFFSLPCHFVGGLTFLTPYILWSVHESCSFCQNIVRCLKFCSEMPGFPYSKNNISSIKIGHTSSPP